MFESREFVRVPICPNIGNKHFFQKDWVELFFEEYKFQSRKKSGKSNVQIS